MTTSCCILRCHRRTRLQIASRMVEEAGSWRIGMSIGHCKARRASPGTQSAHCASPLIFDGTPAGDLTLRTRRRTLTHLVARRSWE